MQSEDSNASSVPKRHRPLGPRGRGKRKGGRQPGILRQLRRDRRKRRGLGVQMSTRIQQQDQSPDDIYL
jgi:hypothetical protein